jgi:hypothetical protein
MIRHTAYTVTSKIADVKFYEECATYKRWTFWDSWKLRRRIKKEAREAAKKTLENIQRIMRGG